MSRKKKILKIAAFITAIVLIVGVIVFANAFVGNPVSKLLAKRAAEKYIDENLPDSDYSIHGMFFDWKSSGCYRVFLTSPSNIDGGFDLLVNMAGVIVYDTYEGYVIDGGNTERRLGKEYHDLCDTVFNSPTYPFDLSYGSLGFTDVQYGSVYDIPDFGIVKEDLVPNKVYNIRELGARSGYLTVYVEDDDVSYERAAEVLLELKEMFDQSGVPFRALCLTLWHPRPEDGLRPEGMVYLNLFLYDDIYEDGLAERVKTAHEEFAEIIEKQNAK